MSHYGLRGSTESFRRLLLGSDDTVQTAAPTALGSYGVNSGSDGDEKDWGRSMRDVSLFAVVVGLLFLALALRNIRDCTRNRRRATSSSAPSSSSTTMNPDAAATVEVTKVKDTTRIELITRALVTKIWVPALVTKIWVPAPPTAKNDNENDHGTDNEANKKIESEIAYVDPVDNLSTEQWNHQDDESEDHNSKSVSEEDAASFRSTTQRSPTGTVSGAGGTLASPVRQMTNTTTTAATEATRMTSKTLTGSSGNTERYLAIDDREIPGCAICLQIFRGGDLVCESNNALCTHVFHRHCMAQWLKKHDECPNCRRLYLLELAKPTLLSQTGATTTVAPTELTHS